MKRFSLKEWLSKNTEFDSIKYRVLDEPCEGLSAWGRTTAGVIALLFSIQFLTGVMLAFHYVPTIEDAHITVAYIEKAVRSGSWIRSLHYHSSVMLPLALAAHLAQMLLRKAYIRGYVSWAFGLILLFLVLAAAATGYALPWDARAFNGANVAASLAGNTPIIGATAQVWLLNGKEISTLTISRFYGLHVFITPALILCCLAARFFFLRNDKEKNFDVEHFNEWSRKQFVRNAIVVAIVFAFIAIFSAKYPAPFGPQVHEAKNYLPRPGPQFLWLFEMQKYLGGKIASLLAVGFPGLIIGGLLSIPLLAKLKLVSAFTDKHRLFVTAFFSLGFVTVACLTLIAVYQDARDSRITTQLAKQEQEEKEFRAAVFKPRTIQLGSFTTTSSDEKSDAQETTQSDMNHKSIVKVPDAYITQCAKCHGKQGEGVTVFPSLVGITTREEEPRTNEDLLGIINNPRLFSLSSKMVSYKDKLTEEEKQEIVRWIASLK